MGCGPARGSRRAAAASARVRRRRLCRAAPSGVFDRRPERLGATRRAERGWWAASRRPMFGWHAPHGKVTVLGQGPMTSRPRPIGPRVGGAPTLCSLSAGRSDRTFGCRPSRNATDPHSQRNPSWQSNVNGRLAPGATARTDRPLVGASPARTAVTRSTGSTTRTFRRCAGSSPSAARSARGGSRERAAAIRARSRALSSARVSLRCCRTSPRARTSAGNAASAPAVARAETGSGQRPASCPGDWVLAG